MRACEADHLYILKFSHGGKEGPEIHGLGSSFVGAKDAVNEKYGLLSSIANCQVVDVYILELSNLAANVEWLILDQVKRTDPLRHYYMPSKKLPKPQAKRT